MIRNHIRLLSIPENHQRDRWKCPQHIRVSQLNESSVSEKNWCCILEILLRHFGRLARLLRWGIHRGYMRTGWGCCCGTPWKVNMMWISTRLALRWRHNERDGISNHRCLDCLLYRLFRRSSQKYQSSASLAFERAIQRWPVDSPHKGLATRKMFPFENVIMAWPQIPSWTNADLLTSRTYWTQSIKLLSIVRVFSKKSMWKLFLQN